MLRVFRDLPLARAAALVVVRMELEFARQHAPRGRARGRALRRLRYLLHYRLAVAAEERLSGLRHHRAVTRPVMRPVAQGSRRYVSHCTWPSRCARLLVRARGEP